jgi:hypothetical protein
VRIWDVADALQTPLITGAEETSMKRHSVIPPAQNVREYPKHFPKGREFLKTDRFSPPMTKKELVRRSGRKDHEFMSAIAAIYGLKSLSRQLHLICLTGMDDVMRNLYESEPEKPRSH